MCVWVGGCYVVTCVRLHFLIIEPPPPRHQLSIYSDRKFMIDDAVRSAAAVYILEKNKKTFPIKVFKSLSIYY